MSQVRASLWIGMSASDPPSGTPRGGTGLLPEDYLARALRAMDAEERRREAQLGLALPADAIELDTRVLLLRQVYLAEMAERRYRRAAETAAAMAVVGPLADIGHHDRCRALQALGEVREALGAQRLAARNAPPRRRSFHYWALATLQHFAGDREGALRSLDKGLRHAQADRPLLIAHEAYIRIEGGEAVEDLEGIRQELATARCGQGYGQLILGLIAHEIGDTPAARTHLRAFLRRNASADEVKTATLREELRRARLALAEYEND